MVQQVNRNWGFVTLITLFLIFLDCNLFQATPEGDALQIIKEMLHAEVNWTGNDPCQGWEGLTCALGHVVSLNISGKNLSGKVPAEIGQLSFLNCLDFSNNRIEGTIPNEITNLTNLHRMNFRYNLLSGGFPEVILTLRKLTYLRLDNNHFSFGPLPSGIQKLSSLEYLYLGNCSFFFGRIPPEIGKLTNLKVLSLWGNIINSTLPIELSKLTNLEYLNVHDTHMHGILPPEFGSLHKMRNLSLQGNFFTGTVPDSWSSMVDIQHLNVFDNRLSGPFPTWLSIFSTKISLGCNYFTGTRPTDIPETSFTGNCLDSDLDGHAKSCLHSTSCVSFYSQPENAQSGYRIQHHKENHTWVALGASLVGILVLVIVIFIFYASKIKDKRPVSSQVLLVGTQSNTDTQASDAIEPCEVPNGIRRFSLEEIRKATEGFSKAHEIGFGGFGKVYEGHLDDGHIVAIKRASPSSIHGHKEFQNEIVVLSRLHHRCLVKLEGFCQEAREEILVYEFMTNGSLNKLMSNEQRRCSLGWQKRIEIAIAVAQGLDYLHTFIDPPIIHRDVKPSNILLDEHLNAKLSDFGISRATPEFIDTHISTAPAGTMGYVDPQYFLQRHLGTSSDVYSYGVVLLELITGQKAIDHSRLEEFNLVEWVKLKFREEDLESIKDPHLLNESLHQDLSTVIELALKCSAFEKSKRPSMKDVVHVLDLLLKKKSASQKEQNSPIIESIPSSFPLYGESSTSQPTFTRVDMTLTLTGR